MMRRTVFLLVAALYTVQVFADVEPLTFGDLTERDRYSLVSMSPDGRHLVYQRYDAKSEKNFIEFLNIETQKVSNTLPIRSYRPSRLEWVDDRRAVAFGGFLFSISLDGSELQPLLEPSPEDDKRRYGRSVFQDGLERWWYIGTLPGDDEHVLIGSSNRKEHTRVHKMNLFTGQFRDVVDGGEIKAHEWYLNASGQPVVGIREGRNIHTVLIKHNGEWQAHDKLHAGGDVALDYASDFRSGSARVVSALDNDRDVLLSLRGDDGVYDLVVYDVIAGTIKENFHDEDRYSLRMGLNDFSLVRDSANGQLAAVSYRALNDRHVSDNDDVTAAAELIRTQFPDAVSVPVSGTSRAQRWLFRLPDPAYGDRYALADLKDSSAKVLFDEHPAKPAEQFPTLSAFTIETNDGVMLDAFLLEPAEGVERKAPILVAQHAAFGRHVASYDIDLLYFASHGHPVLEINPRGMAGYGYPLRQAGLANEQERMLGDLEFAANWLRSDPRTAHSAVFGFGIGVGGQAIFALATRSPKALDVISTYAMPVDLLETQKRLLKDERERDAEYYNLSVPEGRSVKKGLRSFSPIENVKRLATPAFMFHSARNSTVPVDEFEAFVKQAEKARDDFEHSLISRKLGGMGDAGVRERHLELVLRFFDRHSP